MMIIHDCLKILKILCKHSPLEAVYMGVDNLYFQNGRVKLCDPFLSRSSLLKELIKPKPLTSQSSKTNLHSVGRLVHKNTETIGQQKQWQLQNLFFIALLASRLLTLRTETDPMKIICD